MSKETKYYSILSAIGWYFCNIVFSPWYDIKSKLHFYKKARKLMKENPDVIKKKQSNI